jgi:acetyltransferase
MSLNTSSATATPTLHRLSKEDLPAGQRFAARLGSDDVRYRFGLGFKDVVGIAEKLLQLGRANSESYAGMDDGSEIAGIANFVQTAPRQAEIALVVRPDQKRHGLGSLLLHRLVLRARQKGINVLHGWVLADNKAMIALARKHGATIGRSMGSQVELLFNLSARAA